MKNILLCTLSLMIVLLLSTCSMKNNTNTELKQFIEVKDKSENIVCQITDTKTITEIIENENIEQWKIGKYINLEITIT